MSEDGKAYSNATWSYQRHPAPASSVTEPKTFTDMLLQKVPGRPKTDPTLKDPHFFAFQGGGHYAASQRLSLGGRLTWYGYGSLDGVFHTRMAGFGNVALSDKSDRGGDLIELSTYARFLASDAWPIPVHAHWTKNLDAGSIAGAGRQDSGWGLALEVGDPRQLAMLGIGYYHLEADFAPAAYIDSDLTDGVTNREAWAFYGTRQVFPNTELSLTLTPHWVKEVRERAMLQALEVLRRRIDDPGTGIPESVVTRQGTDRILVQIPGMSRVPDIFRQTGFLEFKIVRDFALTEALLPG